MSKAIKMPALFEIYWIQLRTQLAVQFQYRIAMLIWLIGMVIEPVMYLVVWSTVAKSQGGAVGGFTAQQFAAYFLVGMLVNHATFTWIMWEYEYYVKEGTLAALLLRPIHPIHKDLADNLAYKALTLTVLVPIAALLALAFRPTFATDGRDLVAFVPALILAGALRFSLEWTLALAAFWATRVDAINQLYFVVLLFFSGRLAPLDLFPAAIQVVAYLLPFRWMVYFPVEVALGRLTPEEIGLGFAAQIIWILLCWLLMRFVWSEGIKRFSAVGA